MCSKTHLGVLCNTPIFKNVCAFPLVVDSNLLKPGHKYTDGVNHVRSRQRICFSFFMPQNISINYLNCFCIKQIDYIFACVFTVIDHSDVTACKEQQSRHSISSRVLRFCSLQVVTSSVIYYSTHTRKNVIYLLNIYIRSIWRLYRLSFFLSKTTQNRIRYCSRKKKKGEASQENNLAKATI